MGKDATPANTKIHTNFITPLDAPKPLGAGDE